MPGFVSEGRRWRTECHSPQTGNGACRSYLLITVCDAKPEATGGYTFSQSNVRVSTAWSSSAIRAEGDLR